MGASAGGSRGETWWAILMGVVCSVATGVLFDQAIGLAGSRENFYGTWCFVLVPLTSGIVGGFVTNWRQIRSGGVGWVVSLLAFTAGSLIFLCFLVEGLVCVMLAAPIVIFSYAAGYFVARATLRAIRNRHRPLALSVVPLLAAASVGLARQTPSEDVRTENSVIEIDAPAQKVWPLLFELSNLPAPSDPLFRAGIAHPISTHSQGQFVGASRECELSTGVMPERIVELEANRKLKFQVLATPPPLRETNPFGKVRALHQHGYYEVRSGEFELTPLPNGRTRLVGTSVYAIRLYPAPYWSFWTDTVVERIHLRVMDEIKRRAEAPNLKGR